MIVGRWQLAVDPLSARYFLWSSGVIEELGYAGSNAGSIVPLISLRWRSHVSHQEQGPQGPQGPHVGAITIRMLQ
jgi:hypothetical protein